MARSYEDPALNYECDLTRERDELLAALTQFAEAVYIGHGGDLKFKSQAVAERALNRANELIDRRK